jgi:3-phenylpropionate/trans-cinnamate dioxygenase ferredoxin reductase component
MSDYEYIVVGGGMTADSAVKGIRERDQKGRISVFSDENVLPYNRPPLSKGLWKGDDPASIWRGTDSHNIEFFPQTRIVAVKPREKSVSTSDGKIYSYEKLLIATGGSPRRLPFGGDDIIYFRTIEDYRKLRSAADRGSEFVVIGGGFIGSEVAAALAMNGKHVTMIMPENGIGFRVFPRSLSTFLVSYYRDKGVSVISGDSITGIDKGGSGFSVKSRAGKTIESDAVVAGLGIVPNEELAKSAGLAVDNGIIVDSFLRTTDRNIYSAGDVANFYSAALDNRMRVEHEDGANVMGLLAGRNMAGSSESYNHLPFFYSDLFELGYEAVGELDSRMDSVEDWVDEFRKGVIYYLKDGIVRGVLLWNTWGKVDAARELIASKKYQVRDSLKGLIKE